MYYKVKRESETGKKLTEIDDIINKFFTNSRQYAEDHGFKNFAFNGLGAFKKLYGFVDPLPETELKYYSKKQSKDGVIYVPNKQYKFGRYLRYSFIMDESLKTIEPDGINKALGITGVAKLLPNTRGIRVIYHSFDNSNEEYYGVQIHEDVIDLSKLSPDLEEITSKEYKLLFN